MELTARQTGTPDLGGRMIKVDHAGEHGAVNIYAGQIIAARFTARHLVRELTEFKAHEERHRAIFGAELARRGRPRCKSYWLCGIGGWLLGVITGLLGSNAIAATTVAVERVVLKHLGEQVDALMLIDPKAVKAILAIVEDERKHHDRSRAQLDADSLWPRVLTPIVSASTEAVIWLGMRM
jgi:3-demethoxyubiquinol 3-hydroxylase